MESNRGFRGRLAFVGLGLYDENGVSLAGLEEIARADTVFAEVYTSALVEGALERLSMKAGKNISVLPRTVIEEGTVLLDECIGKRVALLVVGDPMAATTHVDLRLRAASQNIETAIVHGSSVQTAVPGVLGLQHYKFGRATTLPFPQEGYSPTSPYDVVAENLARGLHTLVLLDIRAEEGAFMTANEGLHLLQDMERRVGKGVITGDRLVCVVARAGSPDCVVRAGRLADLMEEEFGPALHTVVVPGKLHFIEEEALKAFAGMK